MPFFARASWPGDHRDEIVAGALVAAVVVVLGYASGIGAPAAGVQESAAPPAASPAAPSTAPPPDISETGPATGTGGGDGAGGGVWPVTDLPVGGTGTLPGQGTPGGGFTPAPSPTSTSTPSPSPSPSLPGASPSPSATDACSDGQVHLVQPLLKGATEPVTGLLDGLLGTGSSSSPSPSPTSSLCLGVTPSAVPLLDATP